MRKIHKYEQFKLILEEDDFTNDFDEIDQDENLDSGDSEDSSNDEFGDSEEMGEDESSEEVFNENPSHYVEDALKSIELRLVKLFEPPIKDDENKVDIEPSSYHSNGVELVDVKTTDMPLNKTLIIKYHDDDFSYQLLISVGIEQGKPEKSDMEMDTSMVKNCGVKFKKYDIDNNLIGELSRKKVEIESIDQDFLDTLNAELDEKYSVDNGFEIEYKEDDES